MAALPPARDPQRLGRASSRELAGQGPRYSSATCSPPGVEDRAGSAAHLVVTGDRDAGRAFWAFAHGMRILELNGRFPPGADIDAAWRAGLEAFRRYIDR